MTTTNETTKEAPVLTRDDVLNAMLAVGIEFKLPEGDDEGWIMFPPYLRYVDYLNHCEMDPRLMFYAISPAGFHLGPHDLVDTLFAHGASPFMILFFSPRVRRFTYLITLSVWLRVCGHPVKVSAHTTHGS